MTDDERILLAVLAERGYLVADLGRDFRPGEPLDKTPQMCDPCTGWRPTETAQQFFVIRKTDEADAEEHLRAMVRHGVQTRGDWPYKNFYRVGTD
jgi:hypothetical protein